MFKNISLAGIFLCLSSCSSLDLDSTSTYSNNRQAIENNNLAFSDTPILFIADNQKALVPTEPIFEQSFLSEMAVNTAHRRPSLDAFSLDIVNYIINNNEHQLLIHGGDLLNNSCVEEFNVSVETLNRNPNKSWFIAPGNHDGYYLGISSPLNLSKRMIPLHNTLLDERAGWGLTCTPINNERINKVNNLRATGKLNNTQAAGYENLKDYATVHKNIADKSVFNWLYLKALGINEKIAEGVTVDVQPTLSKEFEQYSLRCVDFESQGELHNTFMTDICWTQHESYGDNYFKEQPNKYTYTNNIETQFVERHPWRNFIIQKLTTTFSNEPLDIIIIDTSSYSEGRAIKNNGELYYRSYGAADAAEIVPPQLKIFDKWINENKELNRKTIIVGHHPLFDFNVKSYAAINKAFDSKHVLAYVSGDTHDGYHGTHIFPKEQMNSQVLEVNLGSSIDAPIEYALIGTTQKDNTHSFLAKRYSLTPLVSTETEQVSRPKHRATIIKPKKYKKSGHLDSPKYYAEFNDSLWRKCNDLWTFDSNAKPYDPLSLLSYDERTTIESQNIKQPISYFGLPYLNLTNLDNVRDDALRAYKLNRLKHLAIVYEQMFNAADVVFSDKVKRLQGLAYDEYENLRANNFSSYWTREQEYISTLFRLAELILAIEAELPRIDQEGKDNPNPRVQLFTVCSAIFDAEIEYKAGIFDG